METGKRGSLTNVEEYMSEVFWLALFGGSRLGIFREVHGGIRSVKITGQAFLPSSEVGEIHKITALRGHFHPARDGGRKFFDITGLRVVKKWIRGDEIWKILDPEIQKQAFSGGGFGPYYLRLS